MAKNKKDKKKVTVAVSPTYIPPFLNLLTSLFTENPSKNFSYKQIQKRLKAKGVKVQQNELLKALMLLIDQKKVQEVEPFKYCLMVSDVTYTGILEIHKDGYATVFIEELGLPALVPDVKNIRAFNGDKVKVLLKGVGKKNLRAKVLGVESYNRIEFVGTILPSREYPQDTYICIPQDNKLKVEFIIRGKNIGEAQVGDKVLIQLLRWNAEKPEARVIKVLGAAGTHEVEMNAIMMEFGLPASFPPEVIEEANKLEKTIPPQEIANRKDYRDVLTFTIDPEDAKDFDDAISFRHLPDGNYEIGVHIADVTYYVKEGSALDQEAFQRATSVYLVDRTIPMLPEVLSNDLCSLVPHQDRLTFSAVFVMDAKGEIIREWFGRTVIHSNRRFTYEEVQQILDSGTGEYYEVLNTLNQIAKQLRKERFAQGSINFDTEEVKFKLDEKGKPISVYRKIRTDSHKMIEDFMLLANRRVALRVAKFRKQPPIPFVYRIHAIPEYEKLLNLKAFVKHFGYKLDIDREDRIAESLNELVLSVEGKPEQNIIQTAAIRAMPKAIYTTHNIGHYGLGFKHYSHFTSPIRRYPDILAHRILEKVLNNETNFENAGLEVLCRHCSEREKRATEAERASIKYKQVEYLEGLVGAEFDGLISGLTEWGIFVEIIENKCEGMIPLRDLTDDVYYLDDTKYRLVGRKTGNTFFLGEGVRVKVKKANTLKRMVDFIYLGKIQIKVP
ncbi:MAG: ribonuclease R [Bacteroidia bacterium]|nr:ribonuclease R [Bacteroidia bacterium]MDW8158542.1 ribonuclease R [Bacteroidia bacterium]